MILTREISGFNTVLRNFHLLVQHAVDAVAHAHTFGLRLDVNIRSAFFDGVEQNRVDDADDGRFFARFLVARNRAVVEFGDFVIVAVGVLGLALAFVAFGGIDVLQLLHRLEVIEHLIDAGIVAAPAAVAVEIDFGRCGLAVVGHDLGETVGAVFKRLDL